LRVAVAIAPLAAVLAGLTGCGSGGGGADVVAAAAAETVGPTAPATGTTGSRGTAPSRSTAARSTATAAASTTTTATTAAGTDPEAAVTAVVIEQPAPPSTAPPSTAPPSTAPPSTAPPSTAAPAPAPEAAGPLPSSGPSSPEAARAWELLNGLRRSEGLAALVPTGDAMAKAEALAERMAAEGRLSHSSSPFEGLDDRWQVAVENVGVGTSADHVHQLLEADRPHRDNMVDPRVTAGGIGAAWGADGRLYVAQVLVG
jgi:uncharacterized protein YkwD